MTSLYRNPSIQNKYVVTRIRYKDDIYKIFYDGNKIKINEQVTACPHPSILCRCDINPEFQLISTYLFMKLFEEKGFVCLSQDGLVMEFTPPFVMFLPSTNNKLRKILQHE